MYFDIKIMKIQIKFFYIFCIFSLRSYSRENMKIIFHF